MNDEIEIEILDDGTIKTTTNKVSMPNHANAEKFLLDIAKDAGGRLTREKRATGVAVQTTQQTKTQ